MPRSAETRARWPFLAARGAILHAWRDYLLELSRRSETSPEIGDLVNALQLGTPVGEHVDVADAVWILVNALEGKLKRILENPSADRIVVELCRELLLNLKNVEPVEPFGPMLEKVCDWSRQLYGPLWRNPSRDYVHTDVHPRRVSVGEDPYTIRAECDVTDPDSRVTIIFYPKLLGPHAYATLPMLLVHECVSHVASTERRNCNQSLFIEGLMDWASYFFFEQWVSKITPGLAVAARWHSPRLHQLLVRDEGTKYARETAHMIADRLVHWMETALEDRLTYEEARRQVALLAVALNTVECPTADKDHLVSVLGPPRNPGVAAAVRDWLTNDYRRPERLLEAARGA